jgi:hypothetical protein
MNNHLEYFNFENGLFNSINYSTNMWYINVEMFDNGLGSKGFRVNIIYWNLVDLQCSTSFDCGF